MKLHLVCGEFQQHGTQTAGQRRRTHSYCPSLRPVCSDDSTPLQRPRSGAKPQTNLPFLSDYEMVQRIERETKRQRKYLFQRGSLPVLQRVKSFVDYCQPHCGTRGSSDFQELLILSGRGIVFQPELQEEEEEEQVCFSREHTPPCVC